MFRTIFKVKPMQNACYTFQNTIWFSFLQFILFIIHITLFKLYNHQTLGIKFVVKIVFRSNQQIYREKKTHNKSRNFAKHSQPRKNFKIIWLHDNFQLNYECIVYYSLTQEVGAVQHSIKHLQKNKQQIADAILNIVALYEINIFWYDRV